MFKSSTTCMQRLESKFPLSEGLHVKVSILVNEKGAPITNLIDYLKIRFDSLTQSFVNW